MPLVSIIVPNYNHARFLRRRLDSILAQTFQDYELIILDDASNDNSREIIHTYLIDRRVSCHTNATNSGSPFIQWNRGVALASGKYVWIAESDDYAEKTLLETLVHLLERQPNVGLAYCQSNRIGADDQPLGTLEDWTADLDQQRWKTAFVNCGSDECVNYLLWKNTVPNASAVLFRKDTFMRAGGAPIDMRLCGDWLTWIRILLISDVAFTPLRLNYFRKHLDSVSDTTGVSRHYDEMWKAQRLILKNCRVESAARRKVASQASKAFLTRYRAALPSERRRELICCCASFWAFFLLSPLTVVKCFVYRHSKQI